MVFYDISYVSDFAFTRLNRILKGLDKSWGLHKQAGIIATVFTLAHWLDEKYLTGWCKMAGLLIRDHWEVFR